MSQQSIGVEVVPLWPIANTALNPNGNLGSIPNVRVAFLLVRDYPAPPYVPSVNMKGWISTAIRQGLTKPSPQTVVCDR